MTPDIRHRSLSTNLTISLVATIVILVAVLLGVQHWNLYDTARDELEIKADNYSEELAEILSIPMWTLDTANVRHIGQVYEGNELFSSLRIMDPRGEVLFHYKSPTPPTEETTRRVNIVFEGTVIGQLELSLSMATHQQAAKRLFHATLVNLLATALALFAATGILLRIFLRKPLSELESAMGRVAQGDFSQPFSGPRYRELERIVDSFQKMSGTIRAREESLRRVNEALSINEQRLNMAINAANDGLWDWDFRKKQFYWSPRIYTMLGYKPDEMPASVQVWEEQLHPEDRERAPTDHQEQTASPGEEFHIEFRLRRKDGSYCWILSRGKVTEWNDAGEATRMTGTHQDISERKAAEELRERLINELEEKNAELERFTYTVSHDLKSPLITIKGFLGMLQKDLERNDKENITKDMSRISQAADKMQQLLDELWSSPAWGG